MSGLTRRRLFVGGSLVVAAALVVTGVLLRSGGEDPRPAAAPALVTVGTSNCGAGWVPRAGAQTLQVVNRGTAAADVEVVAVPSGAVHGEVEGLGAGLTRPLDVVLGGGDYAIRCVVEDASPILGAIVHVDGPKGPAGVVPVTDNDLAGPLKQYRAYVTQGLVTLVTRTSELRDAIRAGDLAKARTAWLPAHLAYVRLGAAYGAFGDLDEAITEGVRRLEHGLWHGQSAMQLRPVADKLTADVTSLRDGFPRSQMDPRDLGLRTHEIFEDVDRDTLTGDADQGSGSELAEVSASLDATKELVTVLRPVLTTRYPALSQVDAGLARLNTVLTGLKPYKPLESLSRTDRARLNAAVGDLVEKLAPVAVVLEPRRTS